jgi:CTP:molybdopterin cytidylyltransferase MocA
VIRVGAVVLAAGGSRRLGRPKQLVNVGGRPLIRVVVDQACLSSADEVAVVIGASGTDVGNALAGSRAVLLENPVWTEGVASSIRRAVEWARNRRLEALLVVLGDHAKLRAAYLDVLLAAARAGAPLVASRYADTLGPPAAFARYLFDSLAALEGDHGAGALLRGARDVLAFDWPEGTADVDLAEHAAALEST